MSSYTILGVGRSAKLLRLTSAGVAETITTAPATTLQNLATHLGWLEERTLGVLYQFAHHLNGEPVQLRRALLATFDAAHRGTTRPTLPLAVGIPLLAQWTTDVAQVCRDLPGPVTAAIRDQIGTHLRHLDGVLVPAAINSGAGYQPETITLVINPALESLSDDDWLELFANSEDGFDKYALGSAADELAYLLSEQYDEDTTMSEVLNECRRRRDGGCEVTASPVLVAAWLSDRRPHLMAQWPGVDQQVRG